MRGIVDKGFPGLNFAHPDNLHPKLSNATKGYLTICKVNLNPKPAYTELQQDLRLAAFGAPHRVRAGQACSNGQRVEFREARGVAIPVGVAPGTQEDTRGIPGPCAQPLIAPTRPPTR